MSKTSVETFAGSPTPPLCLESLNHATAFLQPGLQMSRQRKLVHKILNMYGDGVQDMQATVQEELKHVVDWLENGGYSVDLNAVIYPSLINIMTVLLKGKRYEYGSRELQNVQALDEAAARGGTLAFTLLLSVFPFLKYISVGPGKFVRKAHWTYAQFLVDYYGESKETYDRQVTRGMIDFLLRHQEESRLEDGSVWLRDESVQTVIQEVIGAGSLTTTGALYSFFLIITHKPEVAKRIQNEIEAVIGSSRFPNLQDIPEMPFTMSAILELPHVPLGLPHLTTNDVTFKGYFRQRLIPFGIGRRSCIGENFVRSRMFLFITTLLQRFDFLRDPGRPRTFRPGLVMSPGKYPLHVTRR